ncbi:MAG: DUF4296 domain-containing protein [Bacteroidetes bacterium]|nr:DUF4296 domain-containing protein [Bacteroidota bacterium]
MNKLILALFFCFLIACENRDKIPHDVLPKKEMQKIIWDMIQADQFSKQFVLKDSAKKNVKQETTALYDEVFQIHHISKDEFTKSYQFYSSRPDLLKIIFDSLAAQGNRSQQDLYKQQTTPNKPLPTPITKVE